MEDSIEQPRAEGVKSAGPLVDARGIVQKYPLPIGQAESLLALTEEYAFFTPASLYLHGHFFDAPLVDMMAEAGHEIRLFYHRFEQPIFSGLDAVGGDKDWNHVLWAVHREHWHAVRSFLLSTCFSVAAQGTLISFAEQEVWLPDPLVADRKRFMVQAVRLPVVLYCVNSNQYRTYFRLPLPGFDGRFAVAARPLLIFLPPDPQTVERAQALQRAVGLTGNPKS